MSSCIFFYLRSRPEQAFFNFAQKMSFDAMVPSCDIVCHDSLVQLRFLEAEVEPGGG